MRVRSTIPRLRRIGGAVLALLILQSCQPPQHEAPPTPTRTHVEPSNVAATSKTAEPPPVPTSDWRPALLDQAMQVASSPPEKAHASVRSRLQRDVAATAIELGMIDAALRYAEMIRDWREGEVLALAAQALAKGPDRARAQACVSRAVEIALRADGWRKERLYTEIAVALAMLGDVEQARRFSGPVPPELTGRVEAQLSSQVPLEEVDRQCDAFDRAIATGSFDIVRSGIDGYFSVWNRASGDAARTSRAEKAIRGAIPGLPIDLQIEAHIRLAEALARDGRPEPGDAEIDAALRLLQQYEFTPEIRGVIVRDLALALSRRGERGRALQLVSEALDRYRRDVASIVDVDRADFVRPLAEAFAELGDSGRAIDAWTLALAAGSTNPNARPRAEDLCLTCLSIVRSDVEPTDALRRSMREIQNGLKAPW